MKQQVVYFTLPTQGIRPCSLPADEEESPVRDALLPGRIFPLPPASDFLTEVRSHILLHVIGDNNIKIPNRPIAGDCYQGVAGII